jgi:hypothetical protein
MSTRTKTLAAVTVGAVALASGAYAVGSTTGGGSATAANSSQGANTSADDPWIKTLAAKLGVQPDKLAAALDELRPTKGPPKGPGSGPRDDLAQSLADALSLPKADVQAALDKVLPKPVRPGPPGKAGPGRGPGPGRFREKRNDFAAALAKKLGIDESKVQAAIDKFRPGRNGPPDMSAVAKELGVSPAKLKSALQDLRPGREVRHRGGPGKDLDSLAADLAKELNVDEAKVKAALDKVKSDHQQQEQAEWDTFVKALADKLGLPVEKVQQGLGSVPRGGFGGPGHP